MLAFHARPRSLHPTDLPHRLQGPRVTMGPLLCLAAWLHACVGPTHLSLSNLRSLRILLGTPVHVGLWKAHTLSAVSWGRQRLNSRAKFLLAKSPLGEKAGEGHLSRPARDPQAALGLVCITSLLL